MSRNVVLPGLLVLAAAAAANMAGGFSLDAPSSGNSRPESVTIPAATVNTSLAPASFRFAKAASEESMAEPVAPISLTASDGTGLTLVAVEANGVLVPPLAFTELHLTFENPRDQTIEGRFRIALPPGAAISRFAMKIGGEWQEGEVVERQRARQAYEDFLHRKQDPALLEQEAGNEFSARVFPIPSRGRKELIVSFSHAMARADEPYVLPLLGLSSIGQLDVRVLLGDRPVGDAGASNLGGVVSDRRVVELHKRDWTPDRDFEIAQDRVAGRPGLRHGNLAVVRVAAPVQAVSVRQEIAGLYVLVDSSASRALGYTTQVRRIVELMAGLREGAGGSVPVGIAAFDQEVVPVFDGPASGFGQAEARRLGARRPLGASDLDGALGWLAEHLARSGRKHPRVLLITDGVATAGETETRALRAAVHALGASGVERLDVLAVGGLRDEAVLRELTTGNLEHDGQLIEGAASLSEIARRLTLACRSGIKVAVEGAAWVWPESLDGVQPGDEVLVYADLPANRRLRLTLDGRPVTLDGELASVERPLLERAWVQARMDRLMHLREGALGSDDDLRRALGREVAELSVRHRVLSPFTAMLVLETELDYARFGLDRRGLADVLTVGPGGLDVLARSGSAVPSQVQAEASKRAELESLGYVGADVTVEETMDSGLSENEINGGVVGSVPAATPLLDERVSRAVSIPEEMLAQIPEGVEGGAEESIIVESSSPRQSQTAEKERQAAPYSGRFADVMKHLAGGRVEKARALAEAWSTEAPGDVLALLALGEAWEAAGEKAAAARAYGSLIDLFPSRADLRRLAGERLERLGEDGIELAIDTYQKAVLERPDHLSGHRLLAWALLRAGRFEAAFEALEKGCGERLPDGRFAGVDRVMREDLGLLAAAWLRAEPERRQEVLDRVTAQGSRIESEPSLRFVLTWETDANDVDLHVYDRRGDHAFFEHTTLPSGGELYADVTTGYGPECFVVREPGGRGAAPYRLQAHYYSRGPMGYGMGTVQIVAHDGKGRLSIEPRPFVVMADGAMIDLGTVGRESAGEK